MAEVRTKGLKELSAKLKALSVELKADLRKSLVASAEETVAYGKALAPQKSGTLRDSVEWRNGDHELHVIVAAGGAPTTKLVRKSEKGNAPKYDYALAQEGGTEHHDPNQFFRPAVRLARRKHRRRERTAVNRAAKKVAGR